GQALRQSHADRADRRFVARRRVEFRAVGWTARPLLGDQPSLAGAERRASAIADEDRDACRWSFDFHLRRRGLGAVSRQRAAGDRDDSGGARGLVWLAAGERGVGGRSARRGCAALARWLEMDRGVAARRVAAAEHAGVLFALWDAAAAPSARRPVAAAR